MCYKNNREDWITACALIWLLRVSQEISTHMRQDNLRGRRLQAGVSDRWDGEAEFFFFKVRYLLSLPASPFPLLSVPLCWGGGATFHFCKLQGQYTAQYTVSEWGEGTQTKQMWFSIRTNTITDTCLLSSHSSSEFPDLIETRGWKHEWVTSST